jgi:hypothetical protein
MAEPHLFFSEGEVRLAATSGRSVAAPPPPPPSPPRPLLFPLTNDVCSRPQRPAAGLIRYTYPHTLLFVDTPFVLSFARLDQLDRRRNVRLLRLTTVSAATPLATPPTTTTLLAASSHSTPAAYLDTTNAVKHLLCRPFDLTDLTTARGRRICRGRRGSFRGRRPFHQQRLPNACRDGLVGGQGPRSCR